MANKAFLLAVVTMLSVAGTHSTTFNLKNNCAYTVWPGTLSGGGSPALSSTGFELAQGASMSLDAPAGWSGRFWGRTQCATDTTGKFACATADCGSGAIDCKGAGGSPPATLVEITLGNGGAQDFYDVSLVDGYNLPVAIAPSGGTGSCAASSCPADVNAECPNELIVAVGGSTVACKSACLALNTPETCCTGDHGSPATCPPTQYAQYFKGKCPQAYSYAYDDKSSTFTCTGATSYDVTFCP